jgi:DNA-binding IclR family transcriptional regulator
MWLSAGSALPAHATHDLARADPSMLTDRSAAVSPGCAAFRGLNSRPYSARRPKKSAEVPPEFTARTLTTPGDGMRALDRAISERHNNASVEFDSGAQNTIERVLALTALDRGLDVLESVLADAPETPLAAVATRTGLPKPTVHRILGILVRRGYATSAGNGRYGPGPQVFAGAGFANDALRYPGLTGPHLQRLRASTSDTIHLGHRLGDEAVYLDKLDGSRPYRMASVIGMRLALHSSAIGKAILAFAADRDSLLGRLNLESHTRKTITDLPTLVAQLGVVRLCGYAIDDEENEDGIRCIGAPVFDYRGDSVGALSVSAPALAFTTQDAISLAPELIAAADAVSSAIGGTRGALSLPAQSTSDHRTPTRPIRVDRGIASAAKNHRTAGHRHELP